MADLISTIAVKYDGYEADKHVLDAYQFGRSLQGTAKLYNQTLYLFEHGKLPSSRSKYDVRVYVGAPEERCLYIALRSMAVVGQMAMYPELWSKIADWFVPDLIKAAWTRVMNKPDISERILEAFAKESAENRLFAKEMSNMAIGAVVADKNRLHDTIALLAESNKLAARAMVEPVGRSCATVTHSLGAVPFLVADEADAEVIRADDPMEVLDMTEYRCRVEGVDTTNGHCKLLIPGALGPVSGKISDPALMIAGNIYTSALNLKSEIIVMAKATTKNGTIQKLFVSDARDA